MDKEKHDTTTNQQSTDLFIIAQNVRWICLSFFRCLPTDGFHFHPFSLFSFCFSRRGRQVDHVRKWVGVWTTNWWITRTLARLKMSSKMFWSFLNCNAITCTPFYGARRPTTLASATTRRPTRPTRRLFRTDNNNNNSLHITSDNNNSKARSSPAFNSISIVSY